MPRPLFVGLYVLLVVVLSTVAYIGRDKREVVYADAPGSSPPCTEEQLAVFAAAAAGTPVPPQSPLVIDGHTYPTLCALPSEKFYPGILTRLWWWFFPPTPLSMPALPPMPGPDTTPEASSGLPSEDTTTLPSCSDVAPEMFIDSLTPPSAVAPPAAAPSGCIAK